MALGGAPRSAEPIELGPPADAEPAPPRFAPPPPPLSSSPSGPLLLLSPDGSPALAVQPSAPPPPVVEPPRRSLSNPPAPSLLDEPTMRKAPIAAPAPLLLLDEDSAPLALDRPNGAPPPPIPPRDEVTTADPKRNGPSLARLDEVTQLDGASRPAAPATSANPEFDDPPTVQRAGRVTMMRLAAEPDGGEGDFEEVYREFLETKRKCGEPTAGLTFDKFAVKLRQNRDALMGRFACRRVKFSVYIKDGKAALKATPIT
jgi:hypothetical protein